MFKKKDWQRKKKRLKISSTNFFSPKNYHLLSFQIFFSTLGRFVSSRSQSEHDLIFFWLNLLPVSGTISRRRTTPWAEITSRPNPLFLPLGQTFVPCSSALTCVPCSQGHASSRKKKKEKKKNLRYLLIVTFFFTPFRTRETIEGWRGEKRGGQWIHLKREYDYSYSSRGKIFLRIYRRKFVPLRRNLPTLKETEVRRWRRSRKKARALS